MGRSDCGLGRQTITFADLRAVNDLEDLLDIFCSARFLDEAEIAICDSIFPKSSRFLKGNEMRQVIRRDIDDASVGKIIADRIVLMCRIYPFFENIIGLFEFKPSEDLSGFIEHLEDVLGDFSYIVKNKRKDKAKRELKNKIFDVRLAVTALKGAMSEAEEDLEPDFGGSYILYASLLQAKVCKRRVWHDLLFDIEYLDALAELEILKIDQDVEHTQYLGNSGKAHIVDAAHWMSAAWHGPPLVTTPGSDFSLLCSWLYEIGGGSDNESLAGAINRYARGTRRKEVDEYRREQETNPCQVGDEDNFLELKEKLDIARERFKKNSWLLKAPDVSVHCKALILSQLEALKNQIDEAPLRYGPNLVRADRISEMDLRRNQVEFEEHRKKMLKVDVALGRARRGLD